MQLIEQLRRRSHLAALRKETPTHQIKRASMYLDNAATIGILFDGTEPEEREEVLHYADGLRQSGKKVKVLAFFNNKLKGESFAYPAFNRLQVDWAFRPKSREAVEFREQPFDLLLNLSKAAVPPLDWLAAHSKARFRVGPLTPNTHCYDLMIEPAFPNGAGGKMELKAFIQQVVFYLKNMRPKHEQAAA